MVNVLLRRRKLGNTSCNAIARFSQTGIQVVRNDHQLPPDIKWGFRWGCTSEFGAAETVNKSEPIHLVTDKPETRRKLMEAGVPIPQTWYSFEEFDRFIDANPNYNTPLVIRPRTHHQGRHFHLAKSFSELEAATKACPGGYLSEYIEKDREFRVYVVRGRVVCVAEKFVDDKAQLAWNHYQGGSFKNVKWYHWPLKACDIAVKAVAAIGLDFSGVDIMSRGDKSYWVLELNSAPSLTSEYRQRCFAKAFDHLIMEGTKRTIPLSDVKGYKRYIHPAVVDGYEPPQRG